MIVGAGLTWPMLAWSTGAILVALALWGAARSRFANRSSQSSHSPTALSSRSLLRLDFFLPMLRRSSVAVEGWRRWLPKDWASDRSTKRRGLIRRALRRLGASWQAAPGRRIIQSVSLVLFLWLFLVSCWPYSAQPTTPMEIAAIDLVELDQETGELAFNTSEPLEGLRDRTLYLVANQEEAFGPSTIRQAESAEESLRLQCDLDESLLDYVFQSDTQWSLYSSKPGAWPSHYADNLAAKEWIPLEFFLAIDPLVSLSTAIASRSWVWSLGCALGILFICLIIPRGFCGYLCPLGTVIDLFDHCVGKRVTRFRVGKDGWWVHTKYYLLMGILVAAAGGVLVSGYFSAIPIITRAALLVLDPGQTVALRGSHLVPPLHVGHWLSLFLFAAVLSLGFLKPRFWCKYVCPSGAVFSLGNLFRVSERKVESSCIHCNKCVEICPFDAIKPDFNTRVTDCTLCQTCAGVCPTHAIKFVERSNHVELKVLDDPPTHEHQLGRRGFLSLAAGSATALAGGTVAVVAAKSWGATSGDGSNLPVRPPGSVPEKQFLEMCIRCGECFKVCPNNVLQLEGFEQGLEGLWTPMVKADWAGCESSCNACGQVCPTGAIRELTLDEKRTTRMGLAFVNEQTCLPMIGTEECDLCVQECNAAGYEAIEYEQVHTEVDDAGEPIEGSGFLAPVVLEDRCVGCGLCQTRCYAINVKERGVLRSSAIVVKAGEGLEDRLLPNEAVARDDSTTSETSGEEGSTDDDRSGEDAAESPVQGEESPDFGDNPFGLPGQ